MVRSVLDVTGAHTLDTDLLLFVHVFLASKKTSGLYHIAKQLAAVREALTEAADDEVKEAANVRHQNHETVEELEAAKALEEARLENGQEMDPAVIQRYEARKIEVRHLSPLFITPRRKLIRA